ncbi:MAG: peroxide stress protein YaaA [Rickettsiales bacterium]
MLILLSPAKTLNFNCNVPKEISTSIPDFTYEAWQLAEILKTYSAESLGKLMHISPKLSQLNYERFQNFSRNYTDINSKPAIYTYNGDVYEGINLETYTNEQLLFINKNLRILSGMYGILKPFDLIQAYRLEMSTSLGNDKGKNLYQFWGDKITQALNAEANEYIINLASQEYSAAINLKKLKKPLINIIFKEKVQNEYKIIGIHAKKARGLMANFISTALLDNPEHLKHFDVQQYRFSSDFSSSSEYVFVR